MKLLRFLRTPPTGPSDETAHVAQQLRPSGDCPAAESYMQLALGSVQGKKADDLLAHAATCDRCGPTLRLNLEAIERDSNPEELGAISGLASMQEQWQQEMAQKLASTRHRAPPHLWQTRAGRATAFGAIAALILCAALAAWWQDARYKPDRQLALAYSEDRTLQLRIPGASWSNYSAPDHTRGDSLGQEPSALLAARARLARELQKSPQDLHLHELEARAEVLEEHYDPAVDTLARLVATGPVTPELLTDAATAYFQRGLVTGSELDRSTALDYLRRADELAPTDPVVLFNEGIVMEERGQVMNAVEVWNRYLTVERDSKWAAEGKRRLQALETTLNQLKSHQVRIDRTLATPTSMNALAVDTPKLAALDEELATYELDRLLLRAYPLSQRPAATQATNGETVRGSPCDDGCQVARRLLKALGHSLEIQHRDPWITDLLAPNIDSLPTKEQAGFSQALSLFARALRENLSIHPVDGEKSAAKAALIFHSLRGSVDGDAAFRRAAAIGEVRASLEQLVALQQQVDFKGCREFASSKQALWNDALPYPWIHAVKMVTDVVCDSTPDLRLHAHQLALSAMRLAEASRYLYLTSRIQMRIAEAAQDSGDIETSQRLVLEELKKLESKDVPAIRITNTVGLLLYIDDRSIGLRASELYARELLAWVELDHETVFAAILRLDLVRILTQTGQVAEAERQLQLAHKEAKEAGIQDSKSYPLTDAEVALAGCLLERRDLRAAQAYLRSAAARIGRYSEPWGLHRLAATSGQLDLEQGDLAKASTELESEIRRSEGRDRTREGHIAQAEFAELDHDLYAELAAVWLKQGRPAEDALALWERFRMRSRDLPIADCGQQMLSCDAPPLRVALHRLGNNILAGQIILLDRVLIYRADRNGVTWQEKQLQRQDIGTAEQTFERAVSSPNSSAQTVAVLGSGLRDLLLPGAITPSDPTSALLIESDPLLQNLPWPAVPTPSGPLGLATPIADVRSILALRETDLHNSALDAADLFELAGKQALVIGASKPAADTVPLPETIKEAESVSRLLKAPAPLLGTQANSLNIGARIRSAAIFHFAGHARQRTDGTELLLATSSQNDQLPWMDGEFFREHPPRACRLAVLSACSTGSREASWNHPFQDLVETLASSGVTDVVATRWQIDSGSAVPFMDAFYSGLAQGKNVTVALLSARRVLSSHSLYKNPYYWAAYFVTTGQIYREPGDPNGRRQESKQEARNLVR